MVDVNKLSSQKALLIQLSILEIKTHFMSMDKKFQ